MTFDRFYSYESVPSTMDIAREKALAGNEAGSVVMAEFQTRGRGRQGRDWFAPPGANVCLTAIGWPIAAGDAWKVSLVAGVAAAEGLQQATGLPVSVRFPNDIYLQGSKLGGILIETVPDAMPSHVTPLIGIGVNVNVPEEAFPDEIRSRATSMLRATGREFAVGAAAGQILFRLGELWDEIERFEQAILPRWRALTDQDNRRTFLIDGARVRSRVIDVNGDSIVFLEAEDGQRHTLHAAQVILGDD